MRKEKPSSNAHLIHLRICFTLLLCLSLVHRTTAQFAIGIEGGYTKNYLNSSLGYAPFSALKPENSFTVGTSVQYQLNNWLALQTGLSYIKKNYTVRRSGFYEGIYQTTSNSYLKLPLIAHFTVGGGKLKGFMNLGGYGAYWLKSSVRGIQLAQSRNISGSSDPYQYALAQYYDYSFNESLPFNKLRDRRIELGLLTGLGSSYGLNGQCRFFIEARYYYALTDMQKSYMINQIPRYNNTYVIQAGVMFNLKDISQ